MPITTGKDETRILCTGKQSTIGWDALPKIAIVSKQEYTHGKKKKRKKKHWNAEWKNLCHKETLMVAGM